MWIGPARLLSRNRANTSLVGSTWPVMVIASLPAITCRCVLSWCRRSIASCLGGEPNERNCQHFGGAGRGAARLFPDSGDVPLDQTARPEDLSKFTREGGRFRGPGRQPGPL